MQPQGGGFWRPSDDAAQQPSPNAPAQSPPPSAYDGYELTQASSPLDSSSTTIPSEVSWEASEYIQHDKSVSWFVMVIGVAIVLLGVVLLLRQWTFAAVVVAMTTAIVVYARRPPRLLHYHVSNRGLMVEDKAYPYTDFRSFGVIKDGALFSIRLMPRKRFSPPVTVYFAEQDGEQIVDILGTHLPMAHLENDFVDKLVRKVRF